VHIKIDRYADEDKGILLSDRREGRKREKYAFARNESKSIKKLRILPDSNDGVDENVVHDFIPFRVARGKKRKRWEDSSDPFRASIASSSEDEAGHYRSIKGKATAPSKPIDQDVEYATSSDSDYEGRSFDVDDDVRKKTASLSAEVERLPHSVASWIALINHQDALIGHSNSRWGSSRKLTNAERRSTADIKLSIYEKALEKVPMLADGRERLLLCMMEEGSKVWE
jgi:hypothetical protein